VSFQPYVGPVLRVLAIVEMMSELGVGWVLEVLRIPAIIPERRQLRAACVVLADLVRDRCDLTDEEAERAFVPVILAVGESLAGGALDDQLLRREPTTLAFARGVRNRIPDFKELPVGGDVLAELLKAIIEDLVRRAGRQIE
jgi:hypothetical protein